MNTKWKTHDLVSGNPDDDGAVSLLLRKGLPPFSRAVFDGFGCGAVLWAGIEADTDFRMLCDGAEELRLCRENLQILGYDANLVTSGSVQTLGNFAESADTLFFRIPKDLGYARQRLGLWAKHMPRGSRLYLCGENDEGIRNVASKIEWYGALCGEPLIACHSRMYTFERGEDPVDPRDTHYPITFDFDGETISYLSAPGLFSHDRLDAGSALLLEHMPGHIKGKSVLDPGCGSGVLSLAALAGKASRVSACDNSFRACEIASLNLKDRASVIHCYVCDGINDTFDLVVSNPPFHKGTQTIEWIGKTWMRSCARVLHRNGEALIVANRFLDYPSMSAPFFASCTALARSSAFCVWLLKSPVNHPNSRNSGSRRF